MSQKQKVAAELEKAQLDIKQKQERADALREQNLEKIKQTAIEVGQKGKESTPKNQWSFLILRDVINIL